MEEWNVIVEKLDHFYETGRISEVEPYLTEKIEQAEWELQDRLLVNLWSELGGFLRGSGRLEESAAAFDKALIYQKKTAPEDANAKATLLINLAGTYRLWQKYDTAFALYEEAGALVTDGYLYASLLNNKSLLYQDTGRWDNAAKQLQEALERIRELPDCAEEEATTLVNLALLEGKRGNSLAEQECLERAMQSYETRGMLEHPHYAAVLSAIGGSLYRAGQLQAALAKFEQAAALMYRLFGENREYQVILQNIEWIRKQQDGGAESDG